MAAQVVARIQDRLCVELSVTSMFREPTIASLAKWLEDNHPDLVSLLDELGKLSDEEVLHLLEQEELLSGKR
jgi:hypothetical protein